MNTNNVPTLQKENAVKPIHSLTPFTLLDYPHKTACILWFAGCNMRCSYCYNPDIVLGKGTISITEIFTFLEKRKGLLDGVVFSGGECTLHPTLIPMIREIKAMGFLVKIDTNGSHPNILQQLIQENLIDYVALDFKALPLSFQKITQLDSFHLFEESLQLLLQSSVEFEVRTTVHSELFQNRSLQHMVNYLESQDYKGNYYLQYFKNDVPTLGNLKDCNGLKNPSFITKNIQVVIRN